MKHIFAFILVFAVLTKVAHSQLVSSLVKTGENGKLEYTPFANTGESNAVNIISDFSWAGYKYGGVPLPEVAVVLTLNALPGDNLRQIQEAIATVSAMPLDGNGFRGAILFKAGRYEVSAPFRVEASGVVLRGEGQKPAGLGGTELYSTATTQHNFITFAGTAAPSNAGFRVDTLVVPMAEGATDGKFWLNCNVKAAVELEYEGDKTMSLHIAADVNDFASFDSKDTEGSTKPYLELNLYLTDKEKDTTIVIVPTDDAFVQGGDSENINYGSDKNLAIKNAGFNNKVTREIYMKFLLPDYDAEIKSAHLYVYCNNAGNTFDLQNFVELIPTDNWTETTITYANQPTIAENIRITSSYVPSGGKTFTIADASGFKAGDKMMVVRTPNQAWIDALNMAQYGWTPGYYQVQYERSVTAINGNEITIDIPLVQSISDVYGGGEVFLITAGDRTNNCGIENMYLSSYYASNDDELHGWVAVDFSNVQDCWAQNVTAQYFGYACVNINKAMRTTVQECALLDPKSITTGGRKYPFNIEKGSFNLIQRCYARGGRHDFATGALVAGPNVFVDCLGENTFADIGPHHRYATGTLFDNIKGGQIRVQNRMDMGTGHGWAGAQTMFWNLESVTEDIKVESPVGAMNWGIGCKGITKNGDGFWENWGTHVLPRSLYYQQLEDRLGSNAVGNTSTPTQRVGRMWEALAQWRGVGEMPEYVLSNNSKLSDLTVDNQTIENFTPQTLTYTLRLPPEAQIPAIGYEVADNDATVAISNATSVPANTTIEVTAPDGITKSVYSVNFERFTANALLTNIKLNGLAVAGFASDSYIYNIALPEGTSTVPSVTYTKSDAFSTVIINKADAIPGTTSIVVTADDGLTSVSYLVHFTIATSISETQQTAIHLYPIPTRDVLSVEVNDTQAVADTFRIVNIAGTEVMCGRIDSNTLAISVAHLPCGLYFIQFTNRSGVYMTLKFSKIN